MSPTLQVFRKELREVLRDKRVRSSAFVGPFLTVFLMLFVFGVIVSAIGKPSSLRFHVVASGSGTEIIQRLRSMNVSLTEVPSIEAGRKLVRDGKASIVLAFPQEFDALRKSGRPAAINVIFDSKEQRSQITVSALEKLVTETNAARSSDLLRSRGVDPALAKALELRTEDVTRAKGASEIIVGFLPYLIVMWAFFGGVSAASDIIAGEKERKTLETLLISPVRRSEIVLGKFFALATICLMSSLSSLIALMVAANLHIPAIDALFKGGSGISLAACLTILAVLVPTVALFAGLLVAVSSFAKDTREAQTHLNLANFVIILPAVFSQVIGFTEYASARWVSFVPVLNTATTVRSALLGKVDPTSFAITMGVSSILGVAGIFVAVWLFKREEILARV